MADDYFKKCPMCGYIWQSRTDFMIDGRLSMNGYQVDFEDLERGLFYFTHQQEECYSTLAVEVKEFKDLAEVKFRKRPTMEEGCPGYCQQRENLSMCPVECDCVYIRDIMQRIQKMQAEGRA